MAQPIVARDYICQAVCPKLFGLSIIKLSLLLTLIGGVSVEAYASKPADQDESSPIPGSDHPTHQQQHFEDENVPFEDNIPPTGSDLFVLASAPKARKETLDFSRYEESGESLTNPSAEQPTLPQTPMVRGSIGNPQKQSPPKPAKSSSAQVYTRRRSQSHLLLVGDPGTGKSQFLRFASLLCPRSVLTTGVGTTSAGLTCAAVRHGTSGEFALEAGALVLADQGVCCIDEFGCINEKDRTTIHEAMEQQHLSVAKGGIVCKLNCRATIVAVMNPRDCLYDNHSSLSANTGLGTPLLSRFDLIFKLIDTSDAQRDDNITTYLLNQAISGAGNGNQLPMDDNMSLPSSMAQAEPWSIDKLRAYIAIVKELFCPVLSDEAALLLETHYKACRACHSGTIPVTVRFLESLIRLSQAHARLMFRGVVELLDAVAVIRLMECSAFCYGGFDGPSNPDLGVSHYEPLYRDPMTMDFSDRADIDLCVFEHRILQRYGLLNLMSKERRDQAHNAMHNSTLDSQHLQSWADVEGQPQEISGTPADAWVTQPNSVLDHIGQSQSQSQPYPETPGYPQPSSTFEVQDHYGRIHFSQDVNGDRTKRRRQD